MSLPHFTAESWDGIVCPHCHHLHLPTLPPSQPLPPTSLVKQLLPKSQSLLSRHFSHLSGPFSLLPERNTLCSFCPWAAHTQALLLPHWLPFSVSSGGSCSSQPLTIRKTNIGLFSFGGWGTCFSGCRGLDYVTVHPYGYSLPKQTKINTIL